LLAVGAGERTHARLLSGRGLLIGGLIVGVVGNLVAAYLLAFA
jgi:hypothetical protein